MNEKERKALSSAKESENGEFKEGQQIDNLKSENLGSDNTQCYPDSANMEERVSETCCSPADNGDEQTIGRKGSITIPVPHVRQHHTWDCGLACVQMVLRYDRNAQA